MKTTIESSSAVLCDYRRPFQESTQAVFQTMLGWKVDIGNASQNSEIQTHHDLSGIIGFAGALRATIVVSIDKEVAFAAAEAFLGERPTSINGDVRDLVAEVANMIGGGAKERIDLADLSLGLPTTVSGTNHVVSFEPGTIVDVLPFTTPWGPVTVQVAMSQ